MKKLLATAACALFMAASIVQAQVVVRIGPPARPVEYYVEPPHAHAHWVGGHWDHRGEGYVWVEGHWR
jgi:WXXGXW repeat (2 copies)